LCLENKDRKANEEPVLDDTSNIHGQRTCLADQHEHAHVEAKSCSCVGQEYGNVQADLQAIVPSCQSFHDLRGSR